MSETPISATVRLDASELSECVPELAGELNTAITQEAGAIVIPVALLPAGSVVSLTITVGAGTPAPEPEPAPAPEPKLPQPRYLGTRQS